MAFHADLLSHINLRNNVLTGGTGECTERRLSDLAGYFTNEKAYRTALDEQDPIVYTVSTRAKPEGDGQLHVGLGVIQSGKIGNEYYLTKGHLHTWREAAELYIGLEGKGKMLLESEETGESRLVPLTEGSIVYVPGRTAHRTINTSSVPLKYLGVYPANAGHDYAFIAERNFRKVLLERDGKPTLVDRSDLTKVIPTSKSV